MTGELDVPVTEACSEPRPALADDSDWPAQLQLRLSRRPRDNGFVTRLSRARHSGPLYVQKPFYPEGPELAHLYLLHPPGGMVSGDHLSIDVSVEAGAQSLLTTPGAARIYRARPDRRLQQQQVHLQVAEGASLEWFPLETIVFNDANVALDTRIDLAAGSSLCCWEVNCFGLPASDALFHQGQFSQRYRILRDGRPLFIDRMQLDRSGPKAHFDLLNDRAGLQRHAVSGFFICGPFPFARDTSETGDTLAGLIATLRDWLESSALAQRVAISWVGELLIARYLGDSAEQARAAFSHCWSVLRPLLLQRPACAPRIWAT